MFISEEEKKLYRKMSKAGKALFRLIAQLDPDDCAEAEAILRKRMEAGKAKQSATN